MTTVTITKLKFYLLANLDERTGKPVPQWKVGAACDLTADVIGDYARGDRAMTQKAIANLCDYFDCEPADLAGTIDIDVPDQQTSVG